MFTLKYAVYSKLYKPWNNEQKVSRRSIFIHKWRYSWLYPIIDVVHVLYSFARLKPSLNLHQFKLNSLHVMKDGKMAEDTFQTQRCQICMFEVLHMTMFKNSYLLTFFGSKESCLWMGKSKTVEHEKLKIKPGMTEVVFVQKGTAGK